MIGAHSCFVSLALAVKIYMIQVYWWSIFSCMQALLLMLLGRDTLTLVWRISFSGNVLYMTQLPGSRLRDVMPLRFLCI